MRTQEGFAVMPWAMVQLSPNPEDRRPDIEQYVGSSSGLITIVVMTLMSLLGTLVHQRPVCVYVHVKVNVSQPVKFERKLAHFEARHCSMSQLVMVCSSSLRCCFSFATFKADQLPINRPREVSEQLRLRTCPGVVGFEPLSSRSSVSQTERFTPEHTPADVWRRIAETEFLIEAN